VPPSRCRCGSPRRFQCRHRWHCGPVPCRCSSRVLANSGELADGEQDSGERYSICTKPQQPPAAAQSEPARLGPPAAGCPFRGDGGMTSQPVAVAARGSTVGRRRHGFRRFAVPRREHWDVAAFGQLELAAVAGTFGCVVFAQALTQPRCFDPDNTVLAWTEVRPAAVARSKIKTIWAKSHTRSFQLSTAFE
jgi:hypothetical protein